MNGDDLPDDEGRRAGDEARVHAIRVSMMPRDTNWLGTVFGGIILSHIDHAGAVEAQRLVSGRLVTVAMRECVFKEPVFVGDLVSFYTSVVATGRTSVTVRVEVEALRARVPGESIGATGGETVRVTEAEVVYVHVDDDRRAVPLDWVPAPPSAGGV